MAGLFDEYDAAEQAAFEARKQGAATPTPPSDLDNDHARWWPRGLPPEADLERASTLLRNATWKFASTLSHNPHFYALRWTFEADEDFAFLVEFIRQWGYTARFPPKPGGREYILIRVNGFKYWTMGAPVGPVGKDAYDRRTNCILINRKPADAR